MNAGLTSTATRTEQLSFSVGLRDLQTEVKIKKYNCPHLEQDRELNASLGLREWIDSIFSAIDGGRLHETASKPGKASRPKVSQPTTKMLTAVLDQKHVLDKTVSLYLQQQQVDPTKDLEDRMRTALKASGYRPPERPKDPDPIKAFELYLLEFADPIRDAEWAPGASELTAWLTLAKALRSAVVKVHEAAKQEPTKPLFEVEIPAPGGLFFPPSSREPSLTVAEKYFQKYDGVVRAITSVLPRAPKPRAPLEVVSHQVNFVLAANASIGPNWTLVRLKGPTNATSSLLSGTRTRTHGLVITMGEPGSDATKSARAAASISSALKANGIVVSP